MPGRVAVVAAHPDDEILGLGGRLAQLPGLVLVHMTDGAPRDPSDAAAAGFATREQYAAARERELERALCAAAAQLERRITLGVIDQETIFDLASLTRALEPLLASVDGVVTHPYEGGHPDHDAAAFVVQAACIALERARERAPLRLEFASYHALDGGMARGVFWPHPDCPETVLELDAAQRARKRTALAQFVTQRAVIADFPTDVERLRPAPRYDFAAPPPPGEALYDRYGWRVRSALWRREAAQALDALESRC